VEDEVSDGVLVVAGAHPDVLGGEPTEAVLDAGGRLGELGGGEVQEDAVECGVHRGEDRVLKARMAHKKLSLEQAINEALRAGCEREVNFGVEPHSWSFRAGIELEAETLREGLSAPAMRGLGRGGNRL
jgi:hypothetical protein